MQESPGQPSSSEPSAAAASTTLTDVTTTEQQLDYDVSKAAVEHKFFDDSDIGHVLSTNPSWTRSESGKPKKGKAMLSAQLRADIPISWQSERPKAVRKPTDTKITKPKTTVQQQSRPPTIMETPEMAEEVDTKPPSKEEEYTEEDEGGTDMLSRLCALLTYFMYIGIVWDDDDDDEMPYEEEKASSFLSSMAAVFRHLIYNPIYPEFTEMQQACWAVMIGITSGVFTALWQQLIDVCVEFMWKTVPEWLVRVGILTDLNGKFPLPYYMVLCPTICGMVFSYVNAILPTKVPSQDKWIHDTHKLGVLHDTPFWHLFFMSTAAMASGLSLGPEIPLVLLGGMYGSWLGKLTKQTVLHARVMNFTAAAAMVSGFFGFPMAGAVFVLELPHRMGLQYFEAFSPAMIASIMAVITNRLVIGSDVQGYFHYPFLTPRLPSHIFVSAIVYGAFGAVVGVVYGKVVTYLKHVTLGLFHSHHHESLHGSFHSSHHHHSFMISEEGSSLIPSNMSTSHPHSTHHPIRAALRGTIAGLLVGLTGLFLPHVMFWGEYQLQSLIDKGRTPLPIFARGNEPLANLTAYGVCSIDSTNPNVVADGFGVGCSALIAVAKIWTTGLSLGTGIEGGQFWGPLFTGCAASHFFTDLADRMQQYFGFGGFLSVHPCVAMLCIMGSSHVVIFRANTAISLILTLSIAAFDAGNSGQAAGDYSAVFPLLVVAVFVAFILARDYVFSRSQQARGDILAIPEVLCEPKKIGQPLAFNYQDEMNESSHHSGKFDTHSRRNSGVATVSSPSTVSTPVLKEGAAASSTHGGNGASPHTTDLLPPMDSQQHARSSSLVQIVSFGEVSELQPSLLDQARLRSATFQLSEEAVGELHRRQSSTLRESGSSSSSSSSSSAA